MSELLQCLLAFAERAGRLAHAIRDNPVLFSLLVQEKNDSEKNKKFVQDFKTLADVLIQESLRYYICKSFSSLTDHVKGEENACFTNTLGEEITIQIFETEQETCDLLTKVMDGNKEAASILAHIVHEHIQRNIEPDLISNIPPLSYDDVAVWIDPIDSTAEYVKGGRGSCKHSIYLSGLSCVTVLIGVYERCSGLPIMGIINHPFYSWDEINSRWESKIIWGLNYNNTRVNNLNVISPHANDKPIVVLSSTEDQSIKEKLLKRFSIVTAPGAGYKAMVVVLGLADAYYYSKNSTYKWDTNAPHAVLCSVGGGIMDLDKFNGERNLIDKSEDDLTKLQLLYNKEADVNDPSYKWANTRGLVAYRSLDILHQLSSCLH